MKRQNPTLFIGILVILLIILSVARQPFSHLLRDKTGWILSEIGQTGLGFKGFANAISDMHSLKQENRELTAKIQSLEVDRSRIIELEHENGLLQGELGFATEHQTEELVPARIIGREPTSFLNQIVVDRGGSDGITTGMAVVSGGTLVGQVSEVYENQSKVILITSKDSLIQAMLQGSRLKGILRGGISGLTLENVPQDVEYEKGEYVVTSGLGGEIREGIPIGRAKEVQSPSSGIFKDISVEPLADLSRLELVFIEKK